MEEWRQISGFENYEVSNLGNVRKGLRMKGYVHTDPDGYKRIQVGLYKGGKRTNCIVSRLVAKAFIPNPKGLPTVDHIDRNSLNNHVSNLRWASDHTQSMNQDRALGKSGHRYIRKMGNKWWVQIRRHKQHVFSKGFDTLKQAEEARDDFLAIYGDSESDSE